ncbi:hypothetical protein GCM10020370_47790 [Paenibacillus hodogayensis]
MHRVGKTKFFPLLLGVATFLLIAVWHAASGGQAVSAEAASPVTVLSPAEAASAKPGQKVYIQLAAPGWAGIEITENGQIIGSVSGQGPNYAIPLVWTVPGVHVFEAVAVSGTGRSAPRRLPPVVVKPGELDIADISAIARELPANVIDYNGDGRTNTEQDRKDDLKAALRLIRPALSDGYAPEIKEALLQPGPQSGSTRVDYMVPEGRRLYYALADGHRPNPSIGTDASGAAYVPGEPIAGASAYEYVALTEADAAGKVVRFSNIRLNDAFLMASVTGRVRDSLDAPIAGATIRFSAGENNGDGPSAGETTTGAEGTFALQLPPGLYTATLFSPGYESRSYNVTVSRDGTAGVDLLAIAKIEAGQIRIVLTWGEHPRDLDSHLIGPNGQGGAFHVYYGQREAVNGSNEKIAVLNRDDVDSNGEETVTIMTLSRHVYGTYTYFVHQYSQDGRLRESGAQVRIYEGIEQPDHTVRETLIGSYTALAGSGAERYWNVMRLNVAEAGVMYEPVNAMQESSPELWQLRSAEPVNGSVSSVQMEYTPTAAYDGEPVQQSDLLVTATLNGMPYNLQAVHYDPAERRIGFEPVPRTASVQQLLISVRAAPWAIRLLPGEKKALISVPPLEQDKPSLVALDSLERAGGGFSANLVLNGTAPVVLSLSDMTVSASVYDTVTGSTYAGTITNLELNPVDGLWELYFQLAPPDHPVAFAPQRLTLTVTAAQSSSAFSGAASAELDFYWMMPVMGPNSNSWTRLAALAPSQEYWRRIVAAAQDY